MKKWKIGDSLSEFNYKIELSALAAQDSIAENLTVIWIAKPVHKLIVYEITYNCQVGKDETDAVYNFVICNKKIIFSMFSGQICFIF